MNEVTISDDGRTMTVLSPDGRRKAVLRSKRPLGFSAEHIAIARNDADFFKMNEAGVYRTRQFAPFGRTVFVHVNTGPPTWRLPRVWIERQEGGVTRHCVGAGWLRGLIEVSW